MTLMDGTAFRENLQGRDFLARHQSLAVLPRHRGVLKVSNVWRHLGYPAIDEGQCTCTPFAFRSNIHQSGAPHIFRLNLKSLEVVNGGLVIFRPQEFSHASHERQQATASELEDFRHGLRQLRGEGARCR
nr:hypothetical protein [Bosea sp. REN20]